LTEPSRQAPYGAGVGRADVLAEPVVVHLVDAVDQDETRLGEIVGRGHDHVPKAARRDRLVDPAGDQPVVARDVAFGLRPLAPHDVGAVVEVEAVGCVPVDREAQRPRLVVLDRAHEFIGNQQRAIELPQAAVLALGPDELHHVRMADLEGRHLRAAPPTCRRDRETHLVVDVHEAQRPGGVCAGAGNVGTLGAQRREFITDATTGLQRQPGFVDFLEDAVHRIRDGSGHGAIDGRGRRFVRLRARI
jgi:hypothetical protein